MSMPNPQYDQVIRLGAFVGDRFPLVLSGVDNKTRYMVDDDMVVECLGLYRHARVAIFGEWHGPEDQKPIISTEDLQTCTTGFLVRSATKEEMWEHGCRKVVICLKMGKIDGRYEPFFQAEKVFFYLTHDMGFYNPIV